MTINLADNSPRDEYTVNQGATQQVFTVSFEFFSDADLNVYVDGTLQTLTTDYLTADNNDVNNREDHTSGTDGFIHLTDSITGGSGGTKVVITRSIDLERTSDFPSSGPFDVAALNTELDKTIAMIADAKDGFDRALKLADSDPDVSMDLPLQDNRKGKVLAFNSTTGAPEAGPNIGDVQSIANVTNDIATLADIEDGTDATDAIQTVAGISANVTTVAGVSSNVTTVAGISANVTTVAGDAADITTVAGDSADIQTLADISSDITTAAGISANITTVAGDSADIQSLAAKTTEIGLLGTADAIADMNTLATSAIVNDLDLLADVKADIETLGDVTADITTVAGQVSPTNNIATVAGDSANIGTVAGISADVTTVAGISANTTTVAGISSNVTTVAGISGNVTTVSNNQTDIATVAGISSNVSTVAGISANVTTVAGDTANIATVAGATTNIGTVATDIANVNSVGGSIANVNTVASNLSDVNSFADTYFISATAPSSPTIGDLWFDTTNNVMKVYASGGFVNAGSSVNGTANRETFAVGTAEGSYDGSTTVFPIEYDAGYIDVYLNGIKLDPDNDFTATNGTSITLSSAAATGDIVDMVGYGTFELSDFSIGSANNVDLTGLADDQFLQYNSTSGNFEPATIATDVSGDSTPQLGGNLDVNGNEITSASNGDVTINPNGTGDIVLDANVGIGTSSPDKTLHVSKASSEFRIDNAGAEEYTVGTGTVDGAIFHTYYDRGSSTYIDSISRATTHQFRGSDGNEDMRIDSSGNVGIGTSSPSTSLDVVRNGVQPLRVESTSGTEVAINMVNTGGNVQLEAHSGNFTIDADKVGIGTSSPARGVHIHHASDSLSKSLAFTDNTSGTTSTDGYIIGLDSGQNGYVWNYENSNVYFGTNNTTRLSIKADGKLAYMSEGSTSIRSATDMRQGAAKMWINFETSGTISTEDSYNVSSITDETTATTRITINNDMNANTYSQVLGGCNGPSAGNYGRGTTIRTGYKYAGRYDVVATDLWAPSATDNVNQSTMCHGDLA
jgi:hypothetical protein